MSTLAVAELELTTSMIMNQYIIVLLNVTQQDHQVEEYIILLYS